MSLLTYLLDTMDHETRVIKHLATKVPPGADGYRPTPKQRSLLELMQYLTTCAIVPLEAALTGTWDSAAPREEASRSVTLASFAAAMDRQSAETRALLGRLAESDLDAREATLPWGPKVKLGRALIDMGLKPLVAYRMQLFLYLKSAGRTDLGPANCWVGVDGPPA